MDPFDYDECPPHLASTESLLYQYRRIVQTGLIILAVCILTRILSTGSGKSRPLQDDIRTTPIVPYWTPLFGHVFNMAWNSQQFLESLVRKYREGIFTLNIFGTRLHYVHGPELIAAMVNTNADNADFQSVQARAIVNIFGLSREHAGTFNEIWQEWNACYHQNLLGEPGVTRLINIALQRTKTMVQDLVTGNESEVDQHPWERVSRVSNAINKQGEPVVEADLFPLILDFAGQIVMDSVAGSNLLENSPSFLSDLWSFNTGFVLLGLGLPRWLPIPSLTKAHIARRRLLTSLDAFETALEKDANNENPGPTWSNIDDASDIIKARRTLYRDKNLNTRLRSSLDLTLIWAANANSNPLIFWIILHIYSSPTLLSQIRHEISPFVQVTHPPQQFNLPEPPRFDNIDVDGLCSKAHLLKSIYYECIRLNSYQQSPKVAKQAFVLRTKDKPAYLIKKGDWCFAAHGLHQKDERYFADPSVFKADRFVRVDEKGEKSVNIEGMRPFGGGSSICKGRTFAVKKVMFLVAAIVAMWEMEPAGGGKFKMPEQRIGVAVSGVKENTRVWLKRRRKSDIDRKS